MGGISKIMGEIKLYENQPLPGERENHFLNQNFEIVIY
jgi:hypothetical protein